MSTSANRFIRRGDLLPAGPISDVAEQLLRLARRDRGFVLARTWCADEGFVVWVQDASKQEGIPFFDASLVGALRKAADWAETGEGWAWRASTTEN